MRHFWRNKKIILCYHSVHGKGKTGNVAERGYLSATRSIDEALFEQQVNWLSTFAEFVTVDTLIASKKNQKWQVAFTFDDGYQNNVSHALPILKKYNAPLTWFVNSRYINEPNYMPWWDLMDFISDHLQEDLILRVGNTDLNCLMSERGRRPFPKLMRTLKYAAFSEREDYISSLIDAMKKQGHALQNAMIRPDELRQALAQEPLIHLLPHTHQHVNVGVCAKQHLDAEISTNIHYIQSWSKKPITGFAYPYGNLDCRNTAGMEVLKTHTIQWAVTTDRRYVGKNENLFEIPRMVVTPFMTFSKFKTVVSNLSLLNRAAAIKRSLVN